MARVEFTPNLLRHLECPPQQAAGASVREALEAVFVSHHQLRGYILDDQSRLRKHVNIFIDGQPLYDREYLSDSIRADSEIYVMQALSGG